MSTPTGAVSHRNQAAAWAGEAFRAIRARDATRGALTMTILIAGLIVFLGIHSIAIFASDWRERMLVQLGPRPWRGLYSLVSIAGFVLLIWGYGIARQEPIVLYIPPYWTRYVTAVLMAPVFPLFLAAYLPGRIKSATKHPMLAATKLWAAAHLFSNGTLADLLLFGGFLLWAALDRVSFKWRPTRIIRTAPPRPYNDLIALVVGLAVYFVFTFYLHVRWIGVSPLWK
jgi:uncharacterized membrane protein